MFLLMHVHVIYLRLCLLDLLYVVTYITNQFDFYSGFPRNREIVWNFVMVIPNREIVRKKRFFCFSTEKVRKNVLQTNYAKPCKK